MFSFCRHPIAFHFSSLPDHLVEFQPYQRIYEKEALHASSFRYMVTITVSDIMFAISAQFIFLEDWALLIAFGSILASRLTKRISYAEESWLITLLFLVHLSDVPESGSTCLTACRNAFLPLDEPYLRVSEEQVSEENHDILDEINNLIGEYTSDFSPNVKKKDRLEMLTYGVFVASVVAASFVLPFTFSRYSDNNLPFTYSLAFSAIWYSPHVLVKFFRHQSMREGRAAIALRIYRDVLQRPADPPSVLGDTVIELAESGTETP